MACVVMAVIITMSLVLAPSWLRRRTDHHHLRPTAEWYFFFLFEVLRVIKPSNLTPLATIGCRRSR